MVTHRTNAQSLQPRVSADECFAAMQRHHARSGRAHAVVPSAAAEPPKHSPGDVIYGARAIARFIFAEEAGEELDEKKTRRRVFNLWSYYKKRKEAAGFFKLKGAVCLSKSQWLAFHGLG